MDRITSATGMGFTWDDNGNLLTWDDGVDDWTYRYGPEDRLINVGKNGGFSAHYTYDAGGRRVRSLDGGGVTDYLYSGLNVIDEVSGGAHEKHYYAGGMHIASNSGGTIEYYHQDHLGSTRLKTDGAGDVVYESNYEPYGPGVDETGSEEFRYTGKQEDPTGLYYFGARYYDSVTGRFTTRDTVLGDLTDPQSLNRYSYCRNNPHKYTDPDGLIFVADDIAALLVCGLIGGSIAGGAYYLHSTPRSEWNAGAFSGAVIAGAMVGASSAVTASAVAAGALSIAVGLGINAVVASSAYVVNSAYNYAGGLELKYDPVVHGADVAMDTVSFLNPISVGNDIVDEVINTFAEEKAKTAIITTIKNAQDYDPWVEDYYYIQPSTVIFDWDIAESNRW